MRTTPSGLSTEPPYPVSLRSNFVWTFTGNAFLAASQWAVLSLIAKLGSAEMLGQYALALAVAAPIMMLSHLNLRAVLATDMDERHPFGEYVAVRHWVTCFGLIALAAVAVVSRYSRPVPAAIMILGTSLAAEQVSDIYYGALQRRERMDQIARSMIARGAISVLALGIILWLTRNLIWAILALPLARLVVLLVYDRPKGSKKERLEHSGFSAELAIARTALPLGVVLMLVSLNTNVPRYAIEHYLSTRALGVFAAVASFVTAGSTVVNALGQSATPRLARHFSRGERAQFLTLTLKLCALALLLGAAGVLAAEVLGKIVLSVIFRPDYAAYSGLLVSVMAAGILIYMAITLGYVITSARSFTVQMPLLAAVGASSGIGSWLLVPWMGLGGAVAALGVAASVQIGGEVLILSRALRRMEPAS